MATVISTSGEENEITPENGESFSLKELQGAVGGLIEIVPLDNEKLLVVDEEGLYKEQYCLNMKASILARRQIVGPAVLCDNDQIR